ncbi:hypothetical protein Misp01_79970 [Microtetraspora sp. NBRC 13810]|uniref:hypothetical protein n=1 Tax=Microtetraspora sp. NBRC 13810 TaxID=3030990 RepID=UPI0024A0CF17|nr:hypothetical protein [Microtetraspora sp. NBRC 13810]GLW12869.1 hypothetical protein Misp01_79970 [Microtetraspora sp. NBRC 13810]
MRFLGINAIFDDPAAVPVSDGRAAPAEQGRFGRRGHGERPPSHTAEAPRRREVFPA